jgi:SulP family sulfate permease
MDWFRSNIAAAQQPSSTRFLTPKKTPFEHAQHDVPILKWLANYKVGQDLKFDLVAGSPWP